MTFLRRKR